MKLTLKKGQLATAHDMLYFLPVGGVKNVHRKRICKLIAKQVEEQNEELETLKKAHAKLDGKGEVVVEGDRIVWADANGYVEAVNALFAEDFAIEGENLQTALQSIKGILESTEKELSGKEAEIFAEIYEQLTEGG